MINFRINLTFTGKTNGCKSRRSTITPFGFPSNLNKLLTIG